MSDPKIQRALISVSDKTGLAELAKALDVAGVAIYSTGGTRTFLEQQGIEARDIARYTGFPEMLEGRLKTLHPKVFGGILSRRDRPDDMQAIADHGIETFELVVVNLYPFEKTVAKPNVDDAEAIEQIDIGGPSLVRAASKNHKFVTIATCPSQYGEIMAALAEEKATPLDLRRRLAGAAFAHTAAYDAAIAAYFARTRGETFPEQICLPITRVTELRYGENSHQQAALYQAGSSSNGGLVGAKQLNGKELSYNNLLDLDSAVGIVRMFDQPAATVIKHNNPCGGAVAVTVAEAAQKALAGDPQSAFGGVLGFNRPIDLATAEALAAPGLFIEAIAAPSFDADALKVLTTKPKWKANVRLLEVGPVTQLQPALSFRQIEGGMLVQQADTQADPKSEWKVVTTTQPAANLLDDLRFGWNMVRHVKSNAIVLATNGTLIGCGAGQMSRVDSVDIAVAKAGERSRGAVLASDAFFPFPDSIHKAAAAGIVAVIQPGGSVKDADVIAACNEHGIAMIFTGRRHFKH